MAIGAVHAFFKMNVLQMHGFAKFVGVVGRNDLAVSVEQIALAIFFIDVLKHPSVAVRI